MKRYETKKNKEEYKDFGTSLKKELILEIKTIRKRKNQTLRVVMNEIVESGLNNIYK